MEGVAYALYDSFRLFQQSEARINVPIVMNEGGTQSRLWRQIISDVFNVPTVFAKRRTGAPFGDAVLAGVAVGAISDYSVCRDWAEYVDQIDPIEENHATYMEYFALYKEVYENNKQSFRSLSQLRDRTVEGA